MLNTFPELLSYGFFAPALLRICVALSLFYLAYMQFGRRAEIVKARIPGFPALSVIFNTLVGLSITFGYYTQIAVIAAIAGFVVGIYMNYRYKHIVILPTSTIIVLIVICLSLLVTGAGT